MLRQATLLCTQLHCGAIRRAVCYTQLAAYSRAKPGRHWASSDRRDALVDHETVDHSV